MMTTRHPFGVVVVVTLWLLLLLQPQQQNGVHAFSARGPSSLPSLAFRGRSTANSRGGGSPADLIVVCFATPEEERAAALSEYLARAHDEKLRAIQQIQSQKDKEIAALKKTIAELQQQQQPPTYSSSATSSNFVNGSLQNDSELQNRLLEMEFKLRAYQDFVAKYIVDAQNQKLLAVKAAETEAMKKMGSQLQLAGSANTPPPPPPSTQPSTATTTLVATQENALYLERNARVAEAAKAGKSRWGDLEVQRAASIQVAAAPPVTVVNGIPGSAAPVVPVAVPAEVQAADHGLRAEGSVSGWSLAERVALGAKAGSNNNASFVVNGSIATKAAVAAQPPTLYQQRNAMVLAAGKAGKSRWGEQELTRVSQWTESLPAAAVSPAAVNAGSIIAAPGEWVNVGAKILGKK